jgi:Coenzyme PQQ synthesis protein D (PqqD)
MTSGEPLHGSDVPARKPDVEWVELEGEAVLYDPEVSMLQRLNRGAAAVWAACDGIDSSDEIARAIAGAHAGSPEEITRDVPAVINRFRRLGLVLPSAGERDAAR